MGGWDYYNVTEDCDLGTRLQRNGYRIALIPSNTGEEAPHTLNGWMRQRTPWNKGFLQTFFVHTRHPMQLFRQLGARRLLAWLVLLPLTQLNLFIGLPTWLGVLVALASGWLKGHDKLTAPELDIAFLLILSGLVLALLAIGLSTTGCLYARKFSLLPVALLTPAYWFLLAFAFYRALWQFVFNPFTWEKTPHAAVLCPEKSGAGGC